MRRSRRVPLRCPLERQACPPKPQLLTFPIVAPAPWLSNAQLPPWRNQLLSNLKSSGSPSFWRDLIPIFRKPGIKEAINEFPSTGRAGRRGAFPGRDPTQASKQGSSPGPSTALTSVDAQQEAHHLPWEPKAYFRASPLQPQLPYHCGQLVIKLPFGGAAESQDGSGGKDRVVLSGPSQVSWFVLLGKYTWSHKMSPSCSYPSVHFIKLNLKVLTADPFREKKEIQMYDILEGILHCSLSGN